MLLRIFRIQTLRARIALCVSLLVIGTLVVGISAVLGILNLHQDLGAATRGYRELRTIYEAGHHITAARDEMSRPSPDIGKATKEVDITFVLLNASPDLDSATRESILAPVKSAAGDPDANVSLNGALSALATASANIRETIEAHEAAAGRDRRSAIVQVCAVCAAILVLGAMISALLYRSVINQMNILGGGVRRFAAGKFDSRVDAGGDREFASLARDFNNMADELETLYRSLEQRVAIKSRQLAQSERLASVGYLAAGVAHEINNPLGIIAGYGERAMQRLDDDPLHAGDPLTADRIRKDLAVMCDEAFRCKQITDRLLMLARGSVNSGKRPLALDQIARDVITSVGGLKQFADRRITLEARADDELKVAGNDGELRQLVLNLVVNALEAVSPGNGQVRIEIARANADVKFHIADNGKGISLDALPHVFEPFFTDKRGSQGPGTGLGLSVAHAIVQDHGGRIEAHSDGPGTGSEFIVWLPRVAGANNLDQPEAANASRDA